MQVIDFSSGVEEAWTYRRNMQFQFGGIVGEVSKHGYNVVVLIIICDLSVANGSVWD